MDASRSFLEDDEPGQSALVTSQEEVDFTDEHQTLPKGSCIAHLSKDFEEARNADGKARGCSVSRLVSPHLCGIRHALDAVKAGTTARYRNLGR